MKKQLYVIILLVLSFIISCATTKKASLVSSSLLNQKSFILTNIDSEAKITLSFEDFRFFGFSGVNNYFGTYEIRRGNMIVINNIATTKMAGPPEIMQTEAEYTQMLNKAYSIELKKDILTIKTLDSNTLIFKEIKK